MNAQEHDQMPSIGFVHYGSACNEQYARRSNQETVFPARGRAAGRPSLAARARRFVESASSASNSMTSDDLDYALALSLQEQFTHEQRTETIPESETDLERRYDPKLIVDERWELLDPHPNVHDLFVQFDAMFFDRKLVNAGVEVRWSPRMTL